MRMDAFQAHQLWVWVLREMIKHDGEVELVALMRDVFNRKEHHSCTRVVNALIRRGYATMRKDGNMIRVQVTELGRAEIRGVETALLEYRDTPPETNAKWTINKKSSKKISRSHRRKKPRRDSSGSTGSPTSNSPTNGSKSS